MEKAKILFVEDEAIITMEIENQLERLEYELTSIVDTDKKLILISIRGLLMDENQEIINNLIDESTEQLDSIIGDVLNLEEERDIEITNKIFRTFHSIKRNISMLGFLKCSTFAHKVEDVVSLIREGKLVPDSRVVDILLKSLDTLRTLFEDIRDRGSDDRDVSEILNLLHFELSDIQKKEPVKPQPPEEILKETKSKLLKILVAEDNFSSRFLLQKLLSPYGDVYVAVNGKEAINAFQESLHQEDPYDLISLDILMPIKDGQSTLKEIRLIEKSKGILPGRGVKIIMTTALTNPKDVMKSFDEMCNGYLFKPIIKEKLLELLEKFGLLNQKLPR